MAQQPTYGWAHTGDARPDFAIDPEPGQESVWDYPRPPVIVEEDREITVQVASLVIAFSRSALRVLETASPPTFYLPAEDVAADLLTANSTSSYCEWKGQANYFDLRHAGGTVSNIAWTYRSPKPAFEKLSNYFCFYPSKAECFVGAERVKPQQSDFYGGWITHDVVGPFKGDGETRGW